MTMAICEVERVWLAHYGRPAIASRISGELDALFRMSLSDGDEIMLRIADNRDGALDLQASILAHIAATDPTLPVPRVLTSVEGEPVVTLSSDGDTQLAAFAISFLSGRPIAETTMHASTKARVFELLAALDRSLADFSHPAAKRTILWDVAKADRIAPLTVAIPDSGLRKRARRALDDWVTHAAPALVGLRHQVIHNDFNPSNILISRQGEISGIIDFGDAIEAPLICDLATAIAYQDIDAGLLALLEVPVRAYSRTCPLTAEELEILPVLVSARAAMVVAITHWRASEDPGNSAYLLRNMPIAARLLGLP